MQSVVRLIAGGYTGTLLLSEQATPARLPAYPFATIKILTLSPEGQAETSGYTSEEEEASASVSYYTISVQVQAFGSTAQADMLQLRAWLATQSAQELADSLELGILSPGTLQSLPALTGAGFEARSVLSLTLSYRYEYVSEQAGMTQIDLTTRLQTPGYPGTGEQISIEQEVSA